MTSNELINITQLTGLIKQSLPKNNIKLIAEVRQPKESRGHIYLNLKDDGGIINGTIWKYNVTDKIKNLKDGDKISVLGKLDFYQGNGKLQLIINKLLSSEGEGELKKLYNKMKLNFEKKGYFLDESKLKVGKVIKNILILSSKNGDAIKDFYHGIEHNKLNITDTFINVSVQGNDCPNSIINVIESDDIYDNDYDMIVITRGGGSFEDLFGFCKKELIESIYNCEIPVLSAVGHKNDTTLLDYVADYVAPTPSLAAQFIVDHNINYLNELEIRKNLILDKLKNNIIVNMDKLNNNKRQLNDQLYFFDNIVDRYKNKLIENLNNKINILNIYYEKYNIQNKIELYSDNTSIDDYNYLLDILENKKDLNILINGKIINLNQYFKK